jgi:peptide/nickel transport system ATP-binding protein
MQEEFNMAVILITHDLGVVAEVADRACVMYAGKIVEQSAIDDIYYLPDHPYTIGLLNSIPRVDQLEGKRLQAIPGQPPSLISLPRGCSFRSRCTYSGLVPNNKCATEVPNLDEKISGHFSRCHLTEAQLVNARNSAGGQA